MWGCSAESFCRADFTKRPPNINKAKNDVNPSTIFEIHILYKSLDGNEQRSMFFIFDNSFCNSFCIVFFLIKQRNFYFRSKLITIGLRNPHLRPIYEVKSEKERSTKAKYWKYYQPQRETRLQKTSTLICFNSSTNQCL